MKNMIRQLIILLGVVSVFLPSAFAQEASLSGYWETDWGQTVFIPDASGYSGTYTEDNGRFNLKYAGDGKYEGYWAEDAAAQECTSKKLDSYHWGRLAIAVPKTRGPMTIKWAYCDDENLTRNWNIRPSNKKPDLTTALIGNWKATWAGYETPYGFITVTGPEAGPNSSNSSIASSFGISGWRKNFSPATLSSQSAEVVGNGEINIHWNYGHLGHWGGDSTLRQESANKIVGEWSYGGDGSPEIWVRSSPHVTYTQAQHGFIDARTDMSRVGSWLLGPVNPIGKVATLSTTYSPPENDMRGNRDTIYLNLYGRDLWGWHALSIDSASGLEPDAYKYICRQGGEQGWSSHSTQDICFEQGGIIGLRVPMSVWADAKPGLKFLQLNSQKIPFKLEVENYPDPVDDEALESEIYSTVLLDDQQSQRRQDKSAGGNYIYPFRPDGAPTKGAATRTLVITGKNLPLDGNSYFASGDERVAYAPIALPDKMTQAFQGAAHSLAKTSAKAGEEVLVVKVTLSPGVQPGVKAFSLNGITAGWGLVFQDQLGKIRFLRAGATPLDFQEKRFYTGETIRVGVSTLSDTLPLTGTEILLESVSVAADKTKPPKRRTLGIFPVTKTEDIKPGHNMAVSELVLLGIKGAPTIVKPSAGETLVQLDKGAKLVATLVDNFSLTALPPGAAADILDKPLRADLWQSALDRVAACAGVNGDANAAGFESEMSGNIEKLIITNWFTTRQTKITKGDQAALILIRDRLIYTVLEENQKLKPYIEARNPERMALRYYSDARANPNAKNNAFWKYRKGTFPNPDYDQKSLSKDPKFNRKYMEIPLAETLDFDAFVKRLKLPVGDTRDRINKMVGAALKTQYDETLLAVDRARKAGNCNLEELVIIAGQKSERAVASILPDLVKLENSRWIPDVTARNYVKSVYLLGAEIRAFEEYAQFDDAYKSMAIAAVAAPVAWAGSAFAAFSGSALATKIAAGTGYLALAADAADMIYFGGKGVLDYVEGEEDYLTALGLSPVLGVETVKAAIAKRQNAGLAAIGIIAPIVGGAATFKSLYKMKNVNKGRTALRGKEGLKSLDELSDVERADVAAYYAYLKESDGGKFTRLFSGERSDMDLLDDLIKQAGGVPADAKAMRALGGVGDELGDGPSLNIREQETFLSDSELQQIDGSFVGDLPSTKRPNTGGAIDDGKTRIPPVKTNQSSSAADASRGSPFEKSFGDSFNVTRAPDGEFDRAADAAGGLPTGLKITDKTTGEEIVVGKKLGGGGFTEVYLDATDSAKTGFVVKKRYVSGEGRYDLETLEKMVHDSETGRKILLKLHDKEKSLFRVADRKGKPIWVRDPDNPGRGYFITREENISSQVNGKTVSNAKERFDARDYGATAEEALTIQLAVRELNQKGVVWIDNKLTNLDVVPDKSSPTGYRAVFFDFDGFRPVAGSDAADMYRKARTNQLAKDAWDQDWSMMKLYGDNGYDDAVYDFRVFGQDMDELWSPGGKGKTGVGYSQLNIVTPNDFKKLVDKVSLERGQAIPYHLPPGVAGQ